MAREVKYLLIGGGLAAFHAAKMLRRTDAEGSILIVSEEAEPPYDRPPLSKEFLRREKSLAEITFEDEATLAGQQIELALATRVTALDADKHEAILADGEAVHFEKALIATGGTPLQLPVPGADLAGVHYLRTAADAAAIAAEAEGSGRRAVIVGGGFIGLEVAASLTQLSVQVTVIEALPHIWPRFADPELAGVFQSYCEQRGVVFQTGDPVRELRGDGRVSAVVTQGGAVFDCDFACIGIGIRPNVELAQAAGLTVDNGIVVDEFLKTSHADIYAAGDVINYPDTFFGKRRRVEHWGHAEYTGQIAARNMAGTETAYNFISYVWSDIFDLHLEFAGDEHEHDQTVQRGRLEDGKFSILYLKDGKMTAYFAVNTEAREFGMFRRLITMRKDLAGREADLANPAFELRELLT